MLQQPQISAERDDRAEHHQIRHRQRRAQRRPGRHPLAEQRRQQQHQDPAAQHLRTGIDEWRRQITATAPDRTERPRNRRRDQRQHALGAGTQFAAGVEPEHADKTHAQAQPFAAAGMMAAQPAKHPGPQRHRGHRDRRHPRRHLLLGNIHQAVAEHQQQTAQYQRVAPLHRRRPRLCLGAAQDKHQRCRDHEAQSTHQKRRKVDQADGNGKIGGAPDQVDRRQRQGQRNERRRSRRQGDAHGGVRDFQVRQFTVSATVVAGGWVKIYGALRAIARFRHR